MKFYLTHIYHPSKETGHNKTRYCIIYEFFEVIWSIMCATYKNISILHTFTMIKSNLDMISANKLEVVIMCIDSI